MLWVIKLTYLFLEESPELLLEDNIGPDEEPGGGGGDGVDADVGLHDEGVGVGNTAVLRLSVYAVDLLQQSAVSRFLGLTRSVMFWFGSGSHFSF